MELLHLNSAETDDLTFLDTLEEISGYLAIINCQRDKISLKSLRVIHGLTLLKNASLYIGQHAVPNNPKSSEVGLKMIVMPKLIAMTRGNAFFENVPFLCYAPSTIDWSLVFDSPGFQYPIIQSSISNEKKKKLCNAVLREELGLPPILPPILPITMTTPSLEELKESTTLDENSFSVESSLLSNHPKLTLSTLEPGFPAEMNTETLIEPLENPAERAGEEESVTISVQSMEEFDDSVSSLRTQRKKSTDNLESVEWLGEGSRPICHKSCTSNHCWGPTKEDCQKSNKCKTDKKCLGSNRCFLQEESNNTTRATVPTEHCCHPECSAGCNGPKATDCWACRHFSLDGMCVAFCPPIIKFDHEGQKFRKNPLGRFILNHKCLTSCPEGYLEDRGFCVRTCTQPDTYQFNGKCKKCSQTDDKECIRKKQCQETCGEQVNVACLEKLKGCTTLKGNIKISQDFFEGSTINEEVKRKLWEGLGSLEELIGTLSITNTGFNLEDLGFLGRLQKISNYQLVESFNTEPSLKDSNLSTISILNTKLKALRLSRLQTVDPLKVGIMLNKLLCYVPDEENWAVFAQTEPKSMETTVTAPMYDENLTSSVQIIENGNHERCSN
ncbi:hypothetical protein Ciccas_001923 [Cichlidogyrus casuarinus]|uniref:receptor protein-tyrosine kinase n=1 Tax=Cichlidogyrus casuarinus TaxID=1844966 RepID=A0ABD2QJ05_9PLAT